jgi:hypothetical protein
VRDLWIAFWEEADIQATSDLKAVSLMINWSPCIILHPEIGFFQNYMMSLLASANGSKQINLIKFLKNKLRGTF